MRLELEASAADRHELRHIRVQSCKALIECGESAPIGPSELREVGVGYLWIANDPFEAHMLVRNVIWPENVTRVLFEFCEKGLCRLCRVATSHQGTQQGTLRDRTGGKIVTLSAEPSFRTLVVDVQGYGQRNKHVGID
jgi:hypothetical protein